jgi:tRNA(Ile)-lysidine synthase
MTAPLEPGEALAGYSKSCKYLAGVSGGADSMAMLEALGRGGFRKVVVCHLSHGIRPGAADVEARMVERRAHRFGYVFEHGICNARVHAKAEGISLEAAARDLRLRFFADCARSHRCRRVFLAHHADDQVETVLHNLVRGAGLAGMAGMAPSSVNGPLTLLRPFLGLRRKDLREWIYASKVPFLEDPTNSQTDSTRNRIRHLLSPAMESTFGHGWERGILRAATIARAENDFLTEATPAPAREIPTEWLASLPHALRRRAILNWLREAGIPEPGFAETERTLSLLKNGGPAKINLPGDFHACRRKGAVILEAGRLSD